MNIIKSLFTVPVLFVIFATLKLIGVIKFSWLWTAVIILAPLWIPLIVVGGILLTVLIFAFIVALLD